MLFAVQGVSTATSTRVSAEELERLVEASNDGELPERSELGAVASGLDNDGPGLKESLAARDVKRGQEGERFSCC